MSKKLPARPWYANLQMLAASLVGFLTVFGSVVGYFVAQANDRRDIKEVQEDVASLSAENEEQAQEIQETATQYMMIQQQLGVISESLKEMRGKR